MPGSEEPRKGYTSGRAPQGKGLTVVPCQLHPPSWGGNTEENRLCSQAHLGAPGGAELGIIPACSFPPPAPAPSPAALGAVILGGMIGL